MPQKYGYMANAHRKENFVCIICNTKNPSFNWSDKHGEGMCDICGTPYQLLQYDKDKNLIKDFMPKCNIKNEWIPVLKQYWKETGEYTGLGQIMFVWQYPECQEGQEKFNAWLKEHKDLIPIDAKILCVQTQRNIP
jgi:hypothetical protein